MTGVLRHIRRLAGAADRGERSDAELLERFTARRDEAAFAALVRRHGPMVLAVCRRLLRQEQDAEDAFQATFLILVRKAAGIARPAALGCWLYEVALRTARRARAQAASRREHERRVPQMPQHDFVAAVAWRDLQPVLDEEISRLPADYREPFVLCCLQGRTYAQAAAQLGCPKGTVWRRLAAARKLLRCRLTRRGLALPAGVLAAALVQGQASASVPARLVAATTGAAVGAAGAAVAAPVAALVQGGLRVTAAPRTKAVLGIVLTLGLAWAGAGLLASETRAPQPARAGNKPGHPAAAQKDAGPAGGAGRGGKRQAAPDGELAVAGRVLDADGRALAGAEVALLNCAPGPHSHRTPLPISLAPWEPFPSDLLGRGRTDGAGRFRLTFSRKALRPTTDGSPVLTVVGLAPGHAVGWAAVSPRPGSKPQAETVLRLPRAEPVRGRLFDLQGAPAAGVKVYVLRAVEGTTGKYTGLSLMEEAPNAPFWPAPATTDAEGNFVLHGLAADLEVVVRVRDDRLATQDLTLRPGARAPVRLVLPPARWIEGRVVTEDTRAPVAGLEVWIRAVTQAPPEQNRVLRTRTDKEGKFRINHYAADRYDLGTGAWEGKPYFRVNSQEFDWTRGAVRHTVEVALLRGLLQSGKVLDTGGRPVAGANLYYLPRLYRNPFIKGDPIEFWERQYSTAFTRADGSFELAVLPGPGHLQVMGRDREYVQYVRTRGELFGSKADESPWPGHAFVKLNVKPGAAPAAVAATLRPAVRVRGQLLDQDGKPLAKARLALVPLATDVHRQSHVPVVEVKDGRFEVKECEAGADYGVLVVDDKHQRAGVGQLTAREGGPGALKVQLHAAGGITARVVEGQGKPVGPRYPVQVWIKGFGKEGPPVGRGVRLPNRLADVVLTDGGGRIALDGLVPGVTYALSALGRELREFAVEPGRKREFGDITVSLK
jgi:RNA polymerase sigma factor (sigma-70 family)